MGQSWLRILVWCGGGEILILTAVVSESQEVPGGFGTEEW